MLVRPSKSNAVERAASTNIRPSNTPVNSLPNNTVAEQTVESLRPLAYTLPEAAMAIGCSPSFMKKRVRDGQGPKSFHIGKKHLILAEELHRWLKDQAGH